MNKKGVVTFAGFWWLGMLTIGLLAVSPTPLRAKFRVRKAIEKCEAAGAPQCEVAVGNMNPDAILAYIKDDDVPDKPLNYGNMNHN